MHARDSHSAGHSDRDAGARSGVTELPTCLRALNVGGGILLLVVAAVIAVVQSAFAPLALPVTLTYPTGSPGAGMPPETIAVTSVNAGIAAVVVLAIAALIRLIAVTPRARAIFADGIEHGRNPMRWIEYSTTSAIMVFVLAQLNGITEVGTLVVIYTLQSASIILLWLQERAGASSGSVQPFVFASVVGIVPWGVMALHVLAPGATSGYDQPVWVRVMTVSMLLLFAAVVANQWRGIRRSGAGMSFLPVERGYLALAVLMPVVFAAQLVGGIVA